MTAMGLISFYCSAVCILLGSTAGATEYKAYALSMLPNAGYGCAYKINDRGIIVGSMAASYDTRSNAGAFQWDTAESAPHYVGFPIGASAMGINYAGTVVGSRYLSADGHLTTLPALLATNGSNTLADVNDAGVVVGGSTYDSSGLSHAALWDDTGVHDLGALDGYSASMATALNLQGLTVGRSWDGLGLVPDRATIWENGNRTQLDPLQGYEFSAAHDINYYGQVVGTSSRWASYYGNGGEFRFLREEATLWQNGGAVGIAVDGMNTYATGINDLGQVVGYAYSYPYYGPSRAFVWHNGTMIWLDSVGAIGTEAYGINEVGWIVGRARGAGGNYYAVVWEPVPEPSSIFVLLCGLGGLRALAKRRAR